MPTPLGELSGLALLARTRGEGDELPADRDPFLDLDVEAASLLVGERGPDAGVARAIFAVALVVLGDEDAQVLQRGCALRPAR